MAEEVEKERNWALILAPVLSSLLTAGLCILMLWLVAERSREDREEWKRAVCSIIVTQDDNYRENPPSTELGRENARDLQSLRKTRGCPPPHS